MIQRSRQRGLKSSERSAPESYGGSGHDLLDGQVPSIILRAAAAPVFTHGTSVGHIPVVTPAALGSLDIRVVTIDGEPWFVAADVGRAIGRTDNTYTLTRPLLADEKGTQTLSTLGGMQAMTVISESGLYKALLRAQRKNPEARAFQDWVTREVLPAIRKDGMYVAGEEKVRTGEMSEDQLTLLVLERLKAKVDRLTAENAVLTDEVERVTVDEYYALTQRYASRKQKVALGTSASHLARKTGTPLERQYRQLGKQQVHVNVYPRALLENSLNPDDVLDDGVNTLELCVFIQFVFPFAIQ